MLVTAAVDMVDRQVFRGATAGAHLTVAPEDVCAEISFTPKLQRAISVTMVVVILAPFLRISRIV
jgi:hypothetical protein